MKKKNYSKLNIIFVVLSFIFAFIILNLENGSILTYAIGINLIIGGAYGIVCIFKKVKFLF